MWENILKNEFYAEEAIVDRIIIPKLEKEWSEIFAWLGGTFYPDMKAEVSAPLSVPPFLTFQLLPWLRLSMDEERKQAKIKTGKLRITHKWEHRIGADVVYSFSISENHIRDELPDLDSETIYAILGTPDNHWITIEHEGARDDIDSVISEVGDKLTALIHHHY